MAVTKQQDVEETLRRWKVDGEVVREQLYGAPTPRERERWHAVWLVRQGWTTAQVAASLGRDPHTVGGWLAAVRRAGPTALTFTHTGGSPPP